MEVKRREFLKSGVATLGAASLGVMAAGVVGRKNVSEAADVPDYKIYALKYAGPFTGSVAMVFLPIRSGTKRLPGIITSGQSRGAAGRSSSIRGCARL